MKRVSIAKHVLFLLLLRSSNQEKKVYKSPSLLFILFFHFGQSNLTYSNMYHEKLAKYQDFMARIAALKDMDIDMKQICHQYIKAHDRHTIHSSIFLLNQITQ